MRTSASANQKRLWRTRYQRPTAAFISYHIIFQSFRLHSLLTALDGSPYVVSVCSVGVGEVFCSVLLVWNLLGGPHESGHIYLLPQSSPLAQCSTATTCTIQTRLCSVPLWTEDLWGTLWHVNLPHFFFSLPDQEGLEPGTFSVRGRRSTNWAIPPPIACVHKESGLCDRMRAGPYDKAYGSKLLPSLS